MGPAVDENESGPVGFASEQTSICNPIPAFWGIQYFLYATLRAGLAVTRWAVVTR
jgi:hypothetical protein